MVLSNIFLKMIRKFVWFLLAILVSHSLPCDSFLLIVPEDLATGLAAVYGFAPRVLKGNDGRAGFGFRFGNHADFQVQYEFGPQLYTRPLKPIRVRSASYRQRVARRRPLIELLLRAGLLKSSSYDLDIVDVDIDHYDHYDEPR